MQGRIGFWIAAAQASFVLLSPIGAAAQPVALVHSQLHGYVASATATAARSGNWSAPSTWTSGAVPGSRARVAIPSGIVVTVDREIATDYDWIRVDGTLRFQPDVRTALVVETLVAMGRLEIGTQESPIRPDVTARLIIHSLGKPIDHGSDPLELTRGVIAMAPVSIHGAGRTEVVSISDLPSAGATTLQLDGDPSGWQIGDELVVAPTVYDQDEVVTITSIRGRTIGITPALKFTRRNVPRSGLQIHVGHLMRNVVIQTDPSQAGDRFLQGHMMLMGGGHRIFNAAFVDFGRTTIRPVSDPILRTDGRRDPSLMVGCGLDEENIRGRYSLHFHNPGPDSPLSIVEGVVVRVKRNAGFKIGIQNHSGYVAVRRAVTHQIDGSHWFGEEGNERGEYRDGLAVHSRGSGASTHVHLSGGCGRRLFPEVYHRRRHDMGHRGAGIWLQGGQVDVVGNVFSGHTQAGIDHVTTGLNVRLDNTFLVEFPIPLLKDSWWLTNEGKDRSTVPIQVPPIVQTDNVIYAIGGPTSGNRAALVYLLGLRLPTWRPRPKNFIARNLAWNVHNCLDASYSSWGRLEDLTCLAGETHPSLARNPRVGVNTQRQSGKYWDYARLRIDGFTAADATGKDRRFFASEGSTFQDVIIDGKPYVATVEACKSYDDVKGVIVGDGIDNDGDGKVDEDCLDEAPRNGRPPETSRSLQPPRNVRIIQR
jgi:hypothetical protein